MFHAKIDNNNQNVTSFVAYWGNSSTTTTTKVTYIHISTIKHNVYSFKSSLTRMFIYVFIYLFFTLLVFPAHDPNRIDEASISMLTCIYISSCITVILLRFAFSTSVVLLSVCFLSAGFHVCILPNHGTRITSWDT